MNKPPSQSSNAPRTSPLAARVRAVGNRRGFFAKSSMAIAGGAALATEQAIAGAGAVATGLHSTGTDTLRVGLIGCGARGRIAAAEALSARSGRVELVAMADAYADQLQSAYRGLKGRHRSLVNVGERRFVGMNAWSELLQCDVDLVILATPPVFRPLQFSAAVQAGKHVMLESFVAVDATGLQQMENAAAIAVDKKLRVAGGLPRRHEARSQDFVRRIHEGAIGHVESIQLHLPPFNLGLPHPVDGMPQRDFELRHWRHFPWAGGLVNQCEHFHLADLADWISQPSPEAKIEFSSDNQRGDVAIHGTEGTFLFGRGQIRDSNSRIRWQSDLKESPGGGTRAQVAAMIQAIDNGQCFDETKLAIAATKSVIGQSV